MSGNKYQLGLVLSGGGARGMSHLGAAKALLEEGYRYDIISGTSMGAIVGCVLADGYHPDEIMSMLTPDLLKSFVRPDLSRDHVMTMKGARAFLKEILRAKNIEDLNIPFVATATNLLKGEMVHIRKGNIIDAVIASASIPVVFEPMKIDNELYVDGGVLNNLPVRCIHGQCKKIFGFHVNPKTLGLHDGSVKGITQIAERSFHLAMLGNVLPDKSLCDFYVEHINLDQFSVLDFEKAPELFDIGYKNTKESLAKYKKK